MSYSFKKRSSVLTAETLYSLASYSSIGRDVGKHTPLYELHKQSQAKLVDFAGWDMPLHYGSQIKEHHQVRQHVGIFDVSHMGVLDMQGPEVSTYLRSLLANNVDRLVPGKALYTCMLNEGGGVLDDLIVYKVDDNFFRIVINAGTREKDIAWMKEQASHFNVSIAERKDLAMLALQGPETLEKIKQLLPAEQVDNLLNLKPFHFLISKDWFIARTGYTGEDGFEFILPAQDAVSFWQKALASGVMPCGLGARDTLRLEAGLNLYGSDMDETVTPLESNLAWTVAMEPIDRKFIGREALENQIQHGIKSRLVGLVLEGSGIIRNHQKVIFSDGFDGEVTSGGYSPTLEKSIALARVPSETGSQCFVEIRNKKIPAMVIKPPFVRHGKKMF